MSSPTKKRKLNSGNPKSSGLPSRGLEYFFSKQKESKSPNGKIPDDKKSDGEAPNQDQVMTDEEFARKLQAEWDKEAESVGRVSGSPAVAAVSDPPKSDENFEAIHVPLTSSDPLVGPKKGEIKSKGTLSLQSVTASVDTVSENIPFDESPLTFDPSKYIPQLQEHWASDGGNASYALLTRCFVLINSTSSRIKIVDTLVNCLRVLIEGDPESLLPAVWLATNSISPPYISLELGLGGSAISKALKNVCGLDSRSLKAIYDKYGDAGDVAFEAKKKQSFTLRKPKPLTIKGVYQSLVKVANSQGQGSGEAKQRIVDRLLQEARGGEESRYVVRTLCQHLRIGAVKTTMLIALSRSFLLSRPPGAEFPLKSADELKVLKKEELAELWGKAEEIVKACFARRPNYNDIIPTMLQIGVCDELLARCDLTLHIPLMPMLGSITRDLSEMLTKLQGRDFACEFKYDGQRAQVHCDEKGKVSILSRHLEVMTDKYPDLVELVPKLRGEDVRSFIMEGEVVAVDRETGELKNFQTLTNRARKDVAIGSIKIDVCLFAFDLMYLNGQPLLDRPFRERRSLLRSLFTEIPHHFTWVKSLDATSQDSEAVLDFFKQAIESKCEGIMVKILDNMPDLPAPSGTIEDSDRVAEEVEEGETLALPAKTRGKKGKGKGFNNGDTEKKPSSRRKPLLATYEPDKRLDSWLKVKKDYSSSFDTLDLVPVAGWHGQGRKAKWWSPMLMAVRNDATGTLDVVCKCMSGFTDAFYKANKKFYDDGSGEEPPDSNDSKQGEEEEGKDNGEANVDENDSRRYKNVRKTKPSFVEYSGPEPDVWFEPQEVWEMAFADITLSPTYTAAIGLASQERGLSLRFPRFLRKREDKGIEEASSSEFLAALYRKQEAKAPVKEEVEQGDKNEL
ncbi:ATP-dependent DNA ligase [Daldinia caldariorum]|uniref:ATP-dependent DNA ligase n=1 Tax=Daldinia caldariorum TaxID=326644 RepID=UPI002007D878|nr:ATP-dependent DNA ligase [Daldinia caldariorum]KAI1469296.1 ATP-dependent DNA ligase [Daldinia caldariorum]